MIVLKKNLGTLLKRVAELDDKSVSDRNVVVGNVFLGEEHDCIRLKC